MIDKMPLERSHDAGSDMAGECEREGLNRLFITSAYVLLAVPPPFGQSWQSGYYLFEASRGKSDARVDL